MADGIGCKCFASHQGECACDADWTPKEVYELKAHINVLREALEELHDDIAEYQRINNISGYYNHAMKNARQALSTTPAQSLQEHDNEVIKRCAETAYAFLDDPYLSGHGYATGCSDAILALKEGN